MDRMKRPRASSPSVRRIQAVPTALAAALGLLLARGAAFAQEMQRDDGSARQAVPDRPRGTEVQAGQAERVPDALGDVDRLESELAAARAKLDDATAASEAAVRRFHEAKIGELSTRRKLLIAQQKVKRLEQSLRVARAVAEMGGGTMSAAWGKQRRALMDAGLASARKIDDYFEGSRSSEDAILDDGAFLRRASLDLRGVVPTVQEVRAFLSDESADKRSRAIDRFLADPRHADYWGLVLRSWILDAAPVVGQGANTIALFEFLRESVAADVPYPEIVHELLTAEGCVVNDGAPSFLVLWEARPADVTAAISRLFLGARLQCAQCHDDPAGGWTQEDFWGVAAYFTGVDSKYIKDPKSWPARPATPLRRTHLPGGIDSVDGERGERRALVATFDKPVIIPHPTDPARRKLMGPKPLGGPRRNDIPNGRRRIEFSHWLTADENPYFHKAIVNRVWKYLVGEPFVPIDGLGEKAAPENAKLLELLASDFREHGGSLGHLMRAIASSRHYQRTIGESSAPPRPLDGYQWLDSVLRATGLEEEVARARGSAGRRQWANDLRAARIQAVRTEGSAAVALREMNHYIVRRGLVEGPATSRIASLPPEERLEEAFLLTLCRVPREAERASFREISQGEPDPMAAAADLLWVLLSSTEFATR